MYSLLRLCVQDRSIHEKNKDSDRNDTIGSVLKVGRHYGKCGGQTSMLIANKMIFVNGEICTVKRKKLYPKDIVKVENIGQFQVVGEQ